MNYPDEMRWVDDQATTPTRTRGLDNFAWWHRLRRHKVERSGYCHPGRTTGMLALVFRCRTCNSEWSWMIF
jgi:hypothetical protein